MKGIQGLIVAIALGLIGGVVNWTYLREQSRQGDTVSFIMVAPEKKIKQGQVFRKEDLATFTIPKKQSTTLQLIAVRDSGGVVGQKATRDYEGNDIILDQDLKTLPQGDLPLEKGEVAIWVPVDNRRFVSNFVVPGKTRVMFRIPRVGPTPAGGTADANLELVGPFDVLSVGNRRGTVDTMKSESVRPMQENVLTIRGRLKSAQQLDDLTSRVTSYLDKTNNRPLDVVLYPEPAAKK